MTAYLRLLFALAAKDLRVEFRSKERFVSLGAFVVLTALLFNSAIDRTAVDPREIASGLIWMILVLGGLLGVGRTFELEKVEGAMDGLLVSPLPRDAIFMGKVISNTLLVLATSLLTLATIALFFGVDFRGDFLLHILVLTVGIIGFSAIGTLFSAITAGTRMGEALLPLLLFPLLVPVVVYGATATAELLAPFPASEVFGKLRILAAFALVALASGAGLFRFIVEE
jgi:heme exporter protein B